MPRAHQILACVIDAAHQITEALLFLAGHKRERQLPGREQPDQPLRVAPVGLDPVPRRARNRPRRDHPHIEPALDRDACEPEPGRPRLIDRARIHAQLFHHGAPRFPGLLTPERRSRIAELELPAAAHLQIETAYSLIDQITERLGPLEAELRCFARRQAGCRALTRHYGVGELTSVAILAELGDARRFSSSRHAVRFAGLDITVAESDQRRAPGKLSHQGSPILRWALFEAAQSACRPGSPDHDYYVETSARLNPKRATLSVARKLARRAHHTLRELGDEALAPLPEAS